MYIFHPSSQGPGPGPGACEEGCKMCFFFKWVAKPWWTPGFQPLQPTSRPCSIEIMYPREWRIAIPASLMRVEHILRNLFFKSGFWKPWDARKGPTTQWHLHLAHTNLQVNDIRCPKDKIFAFWLFLEVPS